jgi:RNA-splicing ligase RtcB
MIELKGKYNTAKVFTDNVEQTAQSQIINLLNQEVFKDSTIRIMPDTHAGAGCVIGFTADFKNKIIPNLVGVDIGCGMHVTKFKADINLEAIDNFIRNNIPHGNSVNKNISDEVVEALNKNHIFSYIEAIADKSQTEFTRHLKSLGSLGGGNHFVEINEDSEGFKYLVIHSGSRNLGLQVAKYYQGLAEKEIKDIVRSLRVKRDKEVGLLEQQGMYSEADVCKFKHDELISKWNVPKELSFLTDELADMYILYMNAAQKFASLNREFISKKILDTFKIKPIEQFETIHNYIENNMIRKGAVSALEGEKLIIPINMRDGSIIAVGKGNGDWNNSAPHGAGRLMSRSQAKEKLDLGEFTESMKDIFTTSVKQSTLDEAPGAYKSMSDILDNIKDTVDVLEIIKPIYNFKA